MDSQSFDPLPNQEQPPKEEASPSICFDTPMLASVLDVSTVDNYLLQTYIVPSFIQAIVWLRKSMKYPQTGIHVWNAATDTTDVSMIPLSNLVRCLIPLVSLCVTRGRTPAMRQMGLEFQATSSQHRQTATHSTIQSRLMFYAVLQFVLPELYPRIRDLLQRRIRFLSESVTSNANYAEDSPSVASSETKSVARQRQRAVLEQIDRLLELLCQNVVPILQLATLVFCWSGILHTSEPALVVSGLTYRRQATSTSPPKLHLALAHRRWLMHHALETFRIVVLPSLILIPRIWNPLLHRYYSSLHTSILQRFRRFLRLLQSKGFRQPMTYDAATAATCPLCNSIPAAVAVQADCTCQQIYCYACFYHSVLLHSADTSTIAAVKHIQSSTTMKNASYEFPMSRKQIYCLRCQDVIRRVTTISGYSNASKKKS
jgi:hypothetical protein